MYKIFTKGSKCYILGTTGDFQYEGLAKDVLIKQARQNSTEFIVRKGVEGFYSTAKIDISDIFDQDGKYSASLHQISKLELQQLLQ